jgi:hypothetical protein
MVSKATRWYEVTEECSVSAYLGQQKVESKLPVGTHLAYIPGLPQGVYFTEENHMIKEKAVVHLKLKVRRVAITDKKYPWSNVRRPSPPQEMPLSGLQAYIDGRLRQAEAEWHNQQSQVPRNAEIVGAVQTSASMGPQVRKKHRF